MPIIQNPIQAVCHVCKRRHPLNPFERGNNHYGLACSHTCGQTLNILKDKDPNAYYDLKRQALKRISARVYARAKHSAKQPVVGQVLPEDGTK